MRFAINPFSLALAAVLALTACDGGSDTSAATAPVTLAANDSASTIAQSFYSYSSTVTGE